MVKALSSSPSTTEKKKKRWVAEYNMFSRLVGSAVQR
jgi:hypothetical protein